MNEQQPLSRRTVLLGTGTAIAGVTALAAIPQPTRAELDVETLTVADENATLAEPPAAVTLRVTGSWEITGPAPEQARVVLQIETGGDARDMAEHIEFDNPLSGDYALSANVLEHPAVTGSDLLPENVDDTNPTELVVRVILLAVNNGSITAETTIEDTATLSVTRDGLELAVQGDGGITVTS